MTALPENRYKIVFTPPKEGEYVNVHVLFDAKHVAKRYSHTSTLRHIHIHTTLIISHIMKSV